MIPAPSTLSHAELAAVAVQERAQPAASGLALTVWGLFSEG